MYDVAEFDSFSAEQLAALIEARRAAYQRLLDAETARA